MIHEVLRYVSPRTYYELHFGNTQRKQLCPFHNEKSPSLDVDFTLGKVYCFGCSKGAPHIVAFHAKVHKLSDEEAASAVWEMCVRPFEPRRRIKDLHTQLKGSSLLLTLKTERALKLSTIEKYELGTENGRITIPVSADGATTVGLRYWLPNNLRDKNGTPKIYHDKGLPHILFNGWRIDADFGKTKTVYLMGAELDAIKASEDGYLAVSGMRGEGIYEHSWTSYFKGKSVVICFGKDAAAGAKKVKNWLATIPHCVPTIAGFPVAAKTIKDYTDYRKAGLIDAQWLAAQVPDASPGSGGLPKAKYVFPSAVAPETPIENLPLVSLNAITEPKYLNSPVRCHAVISGLNYDAYSIPTRFACVRPGHAESFQVDFTEPRDHLFFTDKADEFQQSLVKARAVRDLGVKTKAGEKWMVSPCEQVDVYECYLTPDVGSGNSGLQYVQMHGFCVGEKPETNCRYEMVIMPVADPKSQKLVLMVTKLIPLGTAHQKLSTTELDELKKGMASLKSSTLQELETKLAVVLDDVSKKHTRIISRPDLHLVALLTYLCPLSIFMEGKAERGWIQALAVGDSRTGKSETAIRINNLFGAGEVISSENTSFMGLVGGIQRNGEKSYVIWGRLPRNNEGHLTVEEFSGMATMDIARLTDVRGSGVARIDKGGFAHGTHAMTRQLYLSNPRRGWTVSRFATGVPIVQQLIGGNEDVARFDLILIQSSDEVDMDDVNAFLAKGEYHTPPIISPKTWRLLLRYVWSLRDGDVYLTPEAESAARRCTVALGKKYHHEVPIFKVEDGRYKLARIAAGLACITHNIDSLGKIRVDAVHIEAAARFLEVLWTKPCFGYDRWSNVYIKGDMPNKAEVKKLLLQYLGETELGFISFCEMMKDRPSFVADDIRECGALDTLSSHRFLQALHHIHVIRKLPDNALTKTMWTITPAFREILQSYTSNGQSENYDLRRTSRGARHDPHQANKKPIKFPSATLS